MSAERQHDRKSIYLYYYSILFRASFIIYNIYENKYLVRELFDTFGRMRLALKRAVFDFFWIADYSAAFPLAASSAALSALRVAMTTLATVAIWDEDMPSSELCLGFVWFFAWSSFS